MALYNVGDTVRVRKDLIVGKDYGTNNFVDKMKDLLGKKVKIRFVAMSGEYLLEGNDFNWTNEMFVFIKKGKKLTKEEEAENHIKAVLNERFGYITYIDMEKKVLRIGCKEITFDELKVLIKDFKTLFEKGKK